MTLLDLSMTGEEAGEIGDMSNARHDYLYARLISINTAGFNGHLLASILSSWLIGGNVLPARLGLGKPAFEKLLNSTFPGWHAIFTVPIKELLDYNRIPEWSDLVSLLEEARAGHDESELWLAEIVAAACIGLDHLWQDLGLRSRKDLTELMQRNFPTLAARNDRDMKWKKFLYKQLCEKEGLNACRAPSCTLCADYKNCFGPE